MTCRTDDPLKNSIERLLNCKIVSSRLLTGGDVSGAILVTSTGGDRLVVKTGASTVAGMFNAEADGLRRLRASGAIRTPEVYAVRDSPELTPGQRMIAMEYVPPDTASPHYERTAEFGRKFGAALASLHLSNPSPRGEYGLELISFLGRRPLDNTWRADWSEFYRDQRLLAVLPGCSAALGEELNGKVLGLTDKTAQILSDMPNLACLIHGDLWSGNYLVNASAPVLIDPAAYYGHPEHEWAYIELFGGFPADLRAGYDSITPLDNGYEYRRPLLQLFHILVHVAHFGEPYVPAVARVCQAYGF